MRKCLGAIALSKTKHFRSDNVLRNVWSSIAWWAGFISTLIVYTVSLFLTASSWWALYYGERTTSWMLLHECFWVKVSVSFVWRRMINLDPCITKVIRGINGVVTHYVTAKFLTIGCWLVKGVWREGGLLMTFFSQRGQTMVKPWGKPRLIWICTNLSNCTA